MTPLVGAAVAVIIALIAALCLLRRGTYAAVVCAGAAVLLRVQAGGFQTYRFVHANGVVYALVAVVAYSGAAAIRKALTKSGVRPTQLVALSSGIQGTVAILWIVCADRAQLDAMLTSSFLVAAVTTSILNALCRVLEAKAVAVSDLSVVAPCQAFDPVVQFAGDVVVSVYVCANALWFCEKHWPPAGAEADGPSGQPQCTASSAPTRWRWGRTLWSRRPARRAREGCG
eukprot:TRINITY_DN5741_c0_g1_i2.p1 TRINITY_DN5741_c0_g1~~TRINITY_DN5741_c0_g1_i2.p1  ORF type:complete len:246 (+),score=20.11 TRINITY_DN5741_c0_g1_i2:54-740(+)